jgi:hypothetical protein
MNATIHENIKDFDKTHREKKFKFKTILKTLRQLFCDVRNAKSEFFIMALQICCVNIYYFALFNSSSLKGDKLQILIMFGMA